MKSVLFTLFVLFVIPVNVFAHDFREFSAIKYYTLKGSWGYSTLFINEDLTAQYIKTDNMYDKVDLPGRAVGKIPADMAANIVNLLNKFTFRPEQEPHTGSRNYYSLFEVKSNTSVFVQPYPDSNNADLIPAYKEIEQAFIDCIQYLKEHGETVFISCQAKASADSDRRLTFLIEITNKGNKEFEIENIINQRELASSYSQISGAGPIYNSANTSVIRSNFNLQQEIITLDPGKPLILEIKSNDPIAAGDWAFTVGPTYIQQDISYKELLYISGSASLVELHIE